MIDDLLLCVARLSTYAGDLFLSTATGFYFKRAGRLYLVTSRHVVCDADSGHHPDRLVVEVHTDRNNLTAVTSCILPLYTNGISRWRQGSDAAGEVDMVVLPIADHELPEAGLIVPFTPDHLLAPDEVLAIGTPLVLVGFPLGFQDTLHHLPVARQGMLASSFGFRFQGQGYFLTDARMHRGGSGTPVVAPTGPLPSSQLNSWRLLGVHSARLDLITRDLGIDEALGLNCCWYADMIMTLTDADTDEATGNP